MACQGCGRVSQNRMCCPTCIEFGRTSFFCSQECFTKNWKSHSQLHELLKKKQALAGIGTDSTTDVESGQGSVGSTARPKTTSPTEDMPSTSITSSTRRNLAPLPGGASLVTNFGAEKRSTNGATGAAKRNADNPQIQGVVGDVVGRTWAFVSSALRSSGSGQGLTTTAAGARQRANSGSVPVAQSPRGKVAAAQGGKSPWWSTLTRRFALNGLLWALALTTIVASGMFYREHLRYADEQRVDQAILDVPDIKTGATREVRSGSSIDEATQAQQNDASSVASPLLAGLGLGGASGATAANTADATSNANAATSQVNSLRAEVAALRELVERHDKMLRYVMDRYVEKGIPGSGQADLAAKNSAAHEVTPEDVTKINNDISSATVDETVRAGKAHRKGGHGGEALPMGDVSDEISPSSPAVQEAQTPKDNPVKEASGEVAKEDPSLAQTQDMEQNMLGI